MTGLFTVIFYRLARPRRPLRSGRWVGCVLLLLSLQSYAQTGNAELQLQALANERGELTLELDQYKRTVQKLQSDDTPPERSDNPAIRQLALEMVRIKERLIVVTERELTLLQAQIASARQLAEAAETEQEADSATGSGLESKPLRISARDYSRASEEAHVERLHILLASYYAELQEAARTLPSAEELADRVAAKADAEKLARIPFSADKIRLNGAEGSTALGQITRRLSDPNIPESRRDIALICGIRTQLFGVLIASERRSLKPVGKNNYVARVRLQPGETTLRIKDSRWEIRLPQNLNAGDFLITLYAPPDSPPELHLFSIDDLLGEKAPHIPAWMPADIKLSSRAG